MDGRRRRAYKEGFDLAVGFFGFFAAAFFVITLVYEVLRQDALGWALATLVFAGLVAAFWFGRREVLRRIDQEPGLEED
jgi:membrane protein implicated in regulation of membrane protease activity